MKPKNLSIVVSLCLLIVFSTLIFASEYFYDELESLNYDFEKFVYNDISPRLQSFMDNLLNECEVIWIQTNIGLIQESRYGVCVDVGFIINGKTMMFESFGKCVLENNEIVCDSRHDGNADGICQSGESCIKFIPESDNVVKLMKNSVNDFVDNDATFHLEKIEFEEEEVEKLE